MRPCVYAAALFTALTVTAAPAAFASDSQTLSGTEADQFLATLTAGGVESDAEHPTDDGTQVLLSRIDCGHVFRVERADTPTYSCSVLYSDRMSEDGRHYKVVDLDLTQAQQVFATLKDLFGSRVRGEELVTGAQDIVCLKPASGGETSCTLNRLEQPSST